MLKKLNIKFEKKLLWVVEVFVFFGALYYFAAQSNPKISNSLKSGAGTQTSLSSAVTYSGTAVEGTVICLDIDPNNQLPLLPKDSFNSKIDYLYCYTMFNQNPSSRVTFTWTYRNQTIGEKTVPVNAQKRAAWCKMEMSSERRGKWSVYLTDQNGNEIDKVFFRLY